MDELTFVDRVKNHFGYVETEYGFRMIIAKNSDVRPKTDGVVEYRSDTSAIVVDSETGYAAVWFYRLKDGRRFDLDPVAIHEYLNTTDKEKELLLSVNPKDQPAASALFNQKFLLNQPAWKFNSGIAQNNLEACLKNYASWLKEHADLCLKGDFSRWPAFYEYKINRARADLLRQGKDEFGYVPIKDANGNQKLIKQSIFKEKLDFVSKFKKEFSRE